MYIEKMHQKILGEVVEKFNCPKDAIYVVKLFEEGKSGDWIYPINVSKASRLEEVGEYI